MMMKKHVILATCVLLFLSLAIVASEHSFGPSECCFQFLSTRLPKNKVVSYRYTDKQCVKAAVVFKMKRGGEICAERSLEWVQNIIEAKEMEKY